MENLHAMTDSRVYINKIHSGDRKEIIELANSSIGLHQPWISAPINSSMFKQYFKRISQNDHEGIAIRLEADNQIVGVININNIVRGSFLSASLGYYVSKLHQGHGYMTEALNAVTQFAFRNMGLHRVEANIQPSNQRSKNLVQRCGFEFEGLSKKFLYINGEWKDHERWAIVDTRSTMDIIAHLS